MIASVTIAPRTSLAMCRGGLQGSPKLLTAARSLVNRRNCRRSQRAALPRDLTLRWIPRRRWQEPHRRTPSRSAGSEKPQPGSPPGLQFRLQFSAVRHTSSHDRPRMLVQPEPIRTVATRAANAVRVRALPGFRSPSLRSTKALSPVCRGEGLTHWAGKGGRVPGIVWARREQGQWLTGDRTGCPSFASSAGTSSPTP